ncbi:hypothetical protein CcaverHIS002_0105730 [Cutaneotrichosporon cavernicola]|uniref:Uncharacterized protein n=1 Tax=Cutaneotrichosporon cavernicola TaxID=279322 RepID=A0AA48I4R4_9TREE|nr:uncharacterized protein CcaverHIS019_0105680 [Cutaneotrichosporon cavernicola]BEI80044.1 hypothetical protein CcaverHIS002_0105730 [Cutaneotrichosporon cavernicola]BEI87850.1 hypothetical protein CcaverHIS019_0105680 [Cutaneotrichosporon cavernicola]BEI95624.1 hypothetical protein CcaverHIS631_0105730 [Cutaneotrichosporon cavernicola]BEJ03399.1 hypothetical protein CcaverHIS641_0105740 [Cutaneotrichosporon cavernicola]
MVECIALPLSALLPPLDSDQTRDKEREAAARERLGFDTTPSPQFTALPRLAAVLGPLPPSAPLSVANAFLDLTDLALFETPPLPPHPGLAEPKPHVLVLTGSRADLHLALEEQDAAFLRSHSYALFDRLRRTDIRYCPSVTHLRLLLAVLGSEGLKVAPPSMVVLYDVLGLLMAPEEHDENVPADEERAEDEEPEPVKVLRPGVTLASYLELVAAALDIARVVGASLLILEPGGDGVALPLIASASETVPPTQRTRTAQLSDGLRRLGITVGQVSRLKTETELAGQRTRGARYELKLGGETYAFARRVGTKSEFACPPREEGESLEEGGWVWEWS